MSKTNECVVVSGAGISTSAGIGDFRGKSGKWTERDREKKHGKLLKFFVCVLLHAYKGVGCINASN